jgi:hypothetical protein
MTDYTDQPMDAEHWAELHRLRVEIKGPDGFASWKDAAVAERLRANKVQATLDDLRNRVLEARTRLQNMHAGCNCMTKTPEFKWHDETCPHRVIGEIVIVTFSGSIMSDRCPHHPHQPAGICCNYCVGEQRATNLPAGPTMYRLRLISGVSQSNDSNVGLFFDEKEAHLIGAVLIAIDQASNPEYTRYTVTGEPCQIFTT